MSQHYYEAIERRFALRANGTTVSTEVLAGVTTFLTMAYIIFVQPAVLSACGMDFGAVLVATCLSTAFATALMALLAKYPIAVAPAMGHNDDDRRIAAHRVGGPHGIDSRGPLHVPWVTVVL